MARTRRKALRLMLEGWPCVKEAAERARTKPCDVAKAITKRLPWHLLDVADETQRAAMIAFAVNREAQRIGRLN